MGSNKNEKRKPKSAVYRSFWASVVYFHLRLISTKSHKGEMTRKAVAGLSPGESSNLSISARPEAVILIHFVSGLQPFFTCERRSVHGIQKGVRSDTGTV